MTAAVTTEGLEEAVRKLTQWIDQHPMDQRAVTMLLALCREQRTPEMAFLALQKLTRKHDDSIVLNGLLAGALMEAERCRESLPYFKRALQLVPNQQADFFKVYARALAHCGKFDRAIAMVEEAIRTFPHSVDLYIQQANNYMGLGDQAQVEASYRRGLAVDPHHPVLHNSIALMRFLRTGMQEGFEEYRWRHKLEGAVRLPFSIPEWNGEPLSSLPRLRGRGGVGEIFERESGDAVFPPPNLPPQAGGGVEKKRLLLWAEQGLGDIVMFTSLMPWLLAQGGQITLAVYGKMQPLFARSFPDAEVIALDPALVAAEKNFDYHLPLGELMRLGLPHRTPAAHPPYLKANAALTERLRAKYLDIAQARGATKLIGISWHTANPHTGYLRNIPLAAWAPLLHLPGVQCVSLQYGDHAAEIHAVNRDGGEALYQDRAIDGYKDTDALAAQIAAMDHVVTIQNATAHLAGALGVPTALLLSIASDWRWGLERADSLWYQSVEIIRQKMPLDWSGAMQQARKKVSA